MGWFIGFRQLRRSSIWSNALIVAVMILTFLNLVVVSGILVGLIEGAVTANRIHSTGDLFISPLKENDRVENSQNILKTLSLINDVENVSPRNIVSGTVESNYKERTNFDEEAEKVATIIAGIDPEKEDEVTNISDLLIEGDYLEKDDYDQVLIGSLLLKKYLDIESPSFEVLDDVYIGSKVRLVINNETREFVVKGILKSKVDEVDRRVFMTKNQLRAMMGRIDSNVSEISVSIKDGGSSDRVKEILYRNGFDSDAKIQTFEDAQPKFLQDMKDTFALLGTIISSIGLIVASITVFIVIFINAITRRKFIGIMKGIGVDGVVIELAYVFQSLFYAIVGSGIGIILIYAFLVPYFNNHPIDFPFSDGILVAPLGSTLIRMFLLILATVIAGYVPARIIVKKNTLDSILGRN